MTYLPVTQVGLDASQHHSNRWLRPGVVGAERPCFTKRPADRHIDCRRASRLDKIWARYEPVVELDPVELWRRLRGGLQ